MALLVLCHIGNTEYRCVCETKEEYQKFKEDNGYWNHYVYEMTPTHPLSELGKVLKNEVYEHLKNRTTLFRDKEEYEKEKKLLEKERKKLDVEIEKHKQLKYKFIKSQDSDKSDEESPKPKKKKK